MLSETQAKALMRFEWWASDDVSSAAAETRLRSAGS